jgi:hypothetical protein
MAKETTYAGMLGDLQKLVATLVLNKEELAHLEGPRRRLEALLAQAQEKATQQAALVASKQESSKQLRELIMEGQRMATAVRSMLKEFYGLRSEKLAEFGLQPFRGRPRKVKPEIPENPEVPVETKPKADTNPVS